ncbi:hypothetical protein Lal_00012251 [Lupinus albus]|nr:hypothetical protein Lal_00012251 [Lupinus albus]
MQFESKESTLDAIKQFHIRNLFDYIVVESMLDRYVGRCKHYGAGCEWRICASFNLKRDQESKGNNLLTQSQVKQRQMSKPICLSSILAEDAKPMSSRMIEEAKSGPGILTEEAKLGPCILIEEAKSEERIVTEEAELETWTSN